MRRTVHAAVVVGVVACAMPVMSSVADMIAYEGFAGIDAVDLDGQYTDSTNGFSGTEAWTVSGDTAGVDGWEGRTEGLNYESGRSMLIATGGCVKAFRNTEYNDGSGAGAELRPASPQASTTCTQLYFSALIDADALANANSAMAAWNHHLNGGRRFGFEVRGSTNVHAVRGQDAIVDTGLGLKAGVNLIVVRATEKTGPSGRDEFELWLNPELISPDPPDYSAEIDYGLVVDNSQYGFGGFYLKAAFNGNGGSQQSFLADELRLGESFADVVPSYTPPAGTVVTIL